MNITEQQILNDLKSDIQSKQLENLFASNSCLTEFTPRKLMSAYLDSFIYACMEGKDTEELYEITKHYTTQLSIDDLISNQLKMYGCAIDINNCIRTETKKDNEYYKSMLDVSTSLKVISFMFCTELFSADSKLKYIEPNINNTTKQKNLTSYNSIQNCKLVYSNDDLDVLRSVLHVYKVPSAFIKKTINILKIDRKASSRLNMMTYHHEGFNFEIGIDTVTLANYVIRYFEKDNAYNICKFSKLDVKYQFIDISKHFINRKVITPKKGVVLKINSDKSIESILVKEAYNSSVAFIYGVVRYKNGKEHPYAISLEEYTSFSLCFEDSDIIVTALSEFYGIDDTLKVSDGVPKFTFEVISPYYWKYRDCKYDKSTIIDKDDIEYIELEQQTEVGHFTRKCNGQASAKAKKFAKQVRINLEDGYTIVQDHLRTYKRKI